MSILKMSDQHRNTFRFWDFLGFDSKMYFTLAVFFTFLSFFAAMQIFPASRFPSHMNIIWNSAASLLITTCLIIPIERKSNFIIWFFVGTIGFGMLTQLSASFRVTLPVENVVLNLQSTLIFIMFSSMLSYTFFTRFILWEGKKSVHMETTLKLAQEIHDTLVPAIEEISDRLNVYGLSESIESMGGDLIDYISLDGQRTVYIADVSGHGVSAGIVMSMFKGAMRTMALEKQTIEQLFTRVNHALTPIKKKNMFLTAAGITFDDTSTTAMISSAGHLPVLHFSIKTEGFHRHHIKQIPLGVSDTTLYEGLNVSFDQGDYFVLLTDGLTENRNNFDNLAMLTTIEDCLAPKLKRDMPLDSVSQELFADMKKQGEPIDDRSVIIIKCL